MSVIVKEVYNEKIYLMETTTKEETAISWGIQIIGMVMILIPVIIVIASSVSRRNDVMVAVLMFGGVICFVQMLFGFGRKDIPTYNVHLSGTGEDGIRLIKKTTPEEDQKAICKAVQELEVKAKEMYDHNLGLHDIARNCK